MSNTSITFYPVGNGDTTLIELADGTHILIDCNFRQFSEEELPEDAFDARQDLVDRLERDADGILHIDAFILTHPDVDHCRGLERVFWLGDPSEYDVEDDEEQIVIDELWFAPRILTPHEEGDLCEDAKAFRREARRRIKLHKEGSKSRTDAGNRLRVVGYSDNNELEGLDDVLTVPGSYVNHINGSDRDAVSFFVLAPVKNDTDDKWADRNDTSIVLAAHFFADGASPAAICLFGGDSQCAIWERIWDMNKKDNAEALQWHLLLAPHHCSWHFFSEESYDDNPEASPKIIELLNNQSQVPRAVASSKPIRDDDDNPPHAAAAALYKKHAAPGHFHCTGAFPGEEEPKPMVFTIGDMGVDGPEVWTPPRSASSLRRTIAEPRTYG